MQLQLNLRLLAFARVVTYLAGLMVCGVGGMVLLGWALQIDVLKSFFTGLPPMRPDTALWLVLSGCSLLLQERRERPAWVIAGRIVAALLLGLEVLALGQLLTGWGLSLGVLLGAPQVLPVIIAYFPVALALLFLDREASNGFRPAEALALLACIIPYLTLLGETYNLYYLSRVLPLTGMTIRSAVLLLVLCVGIFCSRADRGLMALLISDTSGGILFRRLLPTLLLLPLVLGWLRLRGERAGYFDASVGLAIVVIGFTLVSLGMLIWNVITFNRLANERLVAERALTRLADIVAFSQDAIIGVESPGLTITSWNRGAENLFGYRADEILGKPLMLLVPAEEHQELLAILAREQRGEHSGPYEAHRLRKDGRLVQVSATLSSVRDAAGRVVGFGAISRDITERKRMQEALEQSEERYRRLVELAPEAVFVLREERIVFANLAGASLVGATGTQELLGRPAEAIIHPADAPMFRQRLRTLSEHGTPMSVSEERVLRSDGTVREVETSAGPIIYEGRPAVLALVRDITERKRAIEEISRRDAEVRKMKELGQLKDQFLSTVSHEMKTPLTLITGYAELMEEKYPHEPLVEGIQEGSRRLTEHVNKMIDFSALVSGTLPLYLSEINFSELLGDLESMIRPGFERQGLQLRIQVDEGTPPVQADPRRVTQMLFELLSNAKRFTPEGGQVGVHVSPCDQEVRIDVWDTGKGISENDLPLIWSAFGHGESGEEAGRGGLGLGLAIVKLLVELHGGHVALKSRPEEGSCFSLFLPLRARVPDSHMPQPPGAA